MGTLFGVMLDAMGARNETAVFLTEAQKRDLLRGLFDAYYRPQADKAVIFDTNRAWTARLPALLGLYPDAKLLCCVRDVAWVMDSIERLVRRNAFEPSRLFATLRSGPPYSAGSRPWRIATGWSASPGRR